MVGDKVTLFWSQHKYVIKIPLGRSNNVATFNLSPGFTRYTAFCTKAGFNPSDKLEDPIIATPAHAVSNGDDSMGGDDDYDGQTDIDLGSDQTKPELGNQPIGTSFELNGPTPSSTHEPNVIQDEEDRQPTNLAAKMLQFHHRFGHISFEASYPRRLQNCPIPACSACLYTLASKGPWWSRTSNNKDKASRPTNPGDCISVNQLVSPTPGLIAQMTGF
jgi:hypothetical protein